MLLLLLALTAVRVQKQRQLLLNVAPLFLVGQRRHSGGQISFGQL